MTFLNTPSSFQSIHADEGFGHSEALHVERIASVSALDAAAPDWDLVQDDCAFRHVLLDHRWVRAWWNAFGQTKDLHGLLVRDETKTRGIVPMVLSRGWEAWPSRDGPFQIADDHANLDIPKWRRIVPIRRVTFPLNIPSQNGRAHALLSGDPAPICRAVIDYWSKRASDWDVMVLEGLPVESGQREAFTAAAAKEGFVALPSGRIRVMYRADLSGGMDAYLARRTSHFRRRRRKQIERCEAAGDLEMTVFRGPNIRRGLSIMFEIERHTWKAQPDDTMRVRIPLDDPLRRFLTEAAVSFAAGDDAVIHIMSLNGLPVGAMMGLSRRKTMLSLLIYLRDDMRDVLNSAPLWDALIRDAIRHGMVELDTHGVTASPKRWSTHEEHYQRLYIFNRNPKARFLRISKALATNLSQLARAVEQDDDGGDDGSH